MYASEIDRIVARDHRGIFDAAAAGEVRAAYLDGVDTADMLECDADDRRACSTSATTPGSSSKACPSRSSRRDGARTFWVETRQIVHVWDDMIDEFNAQVAG